jgi:hypothetical protein
MAKKLIITEKQYDRIHKILLESADIKNTLKQAKIGDILSFKGVNSILKLKVTNINQSNGDIMGDTEKGDKVTLNVNSFNQVTKMIEFKIYNSKKQQVVNTPFQLNDIENLGSQANAQPNEPQSSEPIETGEENYNDDDDYVNGTVYNALISDPELKKLMHHTSWWDSFVSELMGKKAEGKGVLNALKFFSSYQNEKLNQKLGTGFIVGKWAEFEVLQPVSLYYEGPTGKTEELNLNVGSRYRGLNQSINLKERDYQYKVLKLPGRNGAKIYVKEKTNEENVFICNITKPFDNKEGEFVKKTVENIRISFIPSEGYTPTNN